MFSWDKVILNPPVVVFVELEQRTAHTFPLVVDKILDEVKSAYASEDINTIDGVKISFEDRKEWVHLRRSNTEPIIRIYAESATKEAADALAQQIIDIANEIIK